MFISLKLRWQKWAMFFSLARTSLEISATISRLSKLGITDSLYCMMQLILFFLNGGRCFYIDFYFLLSPAKLLPYLIVSNTAGYFKKQDLLTLPVLEHLGFFWLLIFLIWFLLRSFLWPVLPVVLNCP